MTDREREVLRGEADVSDNYRYQIRSRVREKIDRLVEDLEFLAEHQPDIMEDMVNEIQGALSDFLK